MQKPILAGEAEEAARSGQAPRGDHSANQPLVEIGSWQISLSHRHPVLTFYPWTEVDAILSTDEQPEPKRTPLALARYYQSLLDNGTVKTRAELARHLGVSRARVTQVLRRLDSPPDQNEGAA